MNFEKWMRDKALSNRTVSRYQKAIEGSLSEWARKANFISGSILDIRTQSEMSSLVLKIKTLDIFQERNLKGHGMYVAALKKYSRFLYEIKSSPEDAAIEGVIEDRSIDPTEKIQLIKARIGQGRYRTELIKLNPACAVTGYGVPDLLVASHIKPWAKSNNQERLDPHNGLLLIPNIDRAFDQGLITFKQDGRILISNKFTQPEFFGITDEMSVDLTEARQKYMKFHRSSVFQG